MGGSLGAVQVRRVVWSKVLWHAGGSMWVEVRRAIMRRRRKNMDETTEVRSFVGYSCAEIAMDMVVEDCRTTISLPDFCLQKEFRLVHFCYICSVFDRSS